VYAQPVSTLARELISLRTGRKGRKGGRRPPPAPRIREPVLNKVSSTATVSGKPGHLRGVDPLFDGRSRVSGCGTFTWS